MGETGSQLETEWKDIYNKRLKEISAMLKTNNRTLAAARAAVKTAANKAKDVHVIHAPPPPLYDDTSLLISPAKS